MVISSSTRHRMHYYTQNIQVFLQTYELDKQMEPKNTFEMFFIQSLLFLRGFRISFAVNRNTVHLSKWFSSSLAATV